MNNRIGHGFDVHAFCPGNAIILGGVKIPFNKALQAHSDGDVLIHALCDAILGAMGLGDIGHHFPDDEALNLNRNSREFLRIVYQLARKMDYQLNNADITIIAQEPKMKSYLSDMKAILSKDMAIDLSQINIKATTTEKLGYIGQEQGIAVHAVVLFERVVK